jgi:cold shock CspA family protein
VFTAGSAPPTFWIEEMRDLIEKLSAVDDQPPAPQREYGHVIFFHQDRGYGFIRSESIIGADLWFHASHIESGEPLRTAQAVSFLQVTDHKGRLRATATKVENAPTEKAGC